MKSHAYLLEIGQLEPQFGNLGATLRSGPATLNTKQVLEPLLVQCEGSLYRNPNGHVKRLNHHGFGRGLANVDLRRIATMAPILGHRECDFRKSWQEGTLVALTSLGTKRTMERCHFSTSTKTPLYIEPAVLAAKTDTMIAPPNWITKLSNAAAAQMRAMDVLSPLGCHYFYNEADKQWEVTFFVSCTETVGGENDGRITFSRFGLDVFELIKVFSKIESCRWQALSLGEGDEIGPHISITGEFSGESVWLRIPATAPEQFESGRTLDAKTKRMENNW